LRSLLHGNLPGRELDQFYPARTLIVSGRGGTGKSRLPVCIAKSAPQIFGSTLGGWNADIAVGQCLHMLAMPFAAVSRRAGSASNR
jgi:hypothetical protein